MIMQTIWPVNINEARNMQERDRLLLRISAMRREPSFVAGVDAAFDEDSVHAAACLYRYPEMTLLEEAGITGRRTFPYVPGYLLFLEGPVIMDALRRLKKAPDVILVDGQGIAHPRGIGSASHLGVLLDVPTIGCAKTRLLGHYREPGRRKGSWSPLEHEGKTLGAALRTRDDVRPVFVSPGHRIDLEGAIRLVLQCLAGYRIPEPLRCADMLSRRLKAG